MLELHSLAEFDAHLERTGSLDGVVVQDIDLAGRSDELMRISCRGAAFLGCGLRGAVLERLLDGGAVVFPRLPAVPFDMYRARLYGHGELLAGWRPGVPGSFEADARDSQIYRWAERRAKVSAGSGPKTSQTANVSAARAMTAGTNHIVT